LLVVVGLEQDRISIIDCCSGTVRQSLVIPAEPGGVTFDAAGEYLMAVRHDCVWIWKVMDTQSKLHELPNRADYDLYSSSPAFCPGDDRVWALFANEWQLWSVADQKMLSSMPSPKGERLLGLGHTTSGPSEVITYDETSANHPSPTVSVWNLDEQRCIQAISLESWQDVVVSYDLNQAVMRLPESEDLISLWSLRTGCKLRDVRGLFSSLRHAFCADNSHFVSGVPADASVPWTWLAVTDLYAEQQSLIDPGVPFPPALLCSPYTNLFATIANDNRHPVDSTAFWNPTTGQQLGWTSGHAGLTPATSFSPCGGWFATAVDANEMGHMVNPIPKGSVVITDIRPLGNK
jgi:hypothetical protein